MEPHKNIKLIQKKYIHIVSKRFYYHIDIVEFTRIKQHPI